MQVFTRLEGERLVLSVGGEAVIIEINNAEYGRARISVIGDDTDVIVVSEESARKIGYGDLIDGILAEDTQEMEYVAA